MNTTILTLDGWELSPTGKALGESDYCLFYNAALRAEYVEGNLNITVETSRLPTLLPLPLEGWKDKAHSRYTPHGEKWLRVFKDTLEIVTYSHASECWLYYHKGEFWGLSIID